ncbi:hypothetical protein HD554DRAFT_2038682 [Boletus coccyginus]|nr:hypothetical protein HD554DRAFT_2038682 [Boletus coccyginus]
MCGKVVNEDASLRFTHMTAGAKKFFEMHCQADKNTIIGHLKVHVYNHISLEIVNDVFGENVEQSNEEQPIPHHLTPGVHSDAGEPNVGEKPMIEGMDDEIMNDIKDDITLFIGE